MSIRAFSAYTLTILLASGLIFTAYIQRVKAEPTTWTVDDDGTADFHTIQEAINSVNEGDTVYVYSGTYLENVVVNRSVALVGEDKYLTIIDGSGAGNVVEIVADNVTVSNFTIVRGGSYSNAGVFLYSCHFNTITNNLIKDNDGHGIYMSHSSNNFLSANRIENNSDDGILAYFSKNINVTGNMITDNKWGIYLVNTYNDTLVKNIICEGDRGIYAFYHCHTNEISENRIENTRVGLEFIDGCSDNKIYHNNFVNNTKHAVIFSEPIPGIEPSINEWNTDYPSGGNYWSSYEGVDSYSGIYQNETGSDAIGDSLFVIDRDNRDNYPLMYPWRIIRVPSEYSTIQEAVNAAGLGNTVYASSGTYCEHVIINKSISLIGEDRESTIINGEGTGDVIRITQIASNVRISGFTIRGGGTGWPDLGDAIAVYSNNNVICGNNVMNANIGIVMWYSAASGNNISGNYVANSFYGIYLCGANDNIVKENNVTNCNANGIFVLRCHRNIVSENRLSKNCIRVSYASSNLIVKNQVNGSEGHGILLHASCNNRITGNDLVGNGIGIELLKHVHTESEDNIIYENNIESNRIGINILSSSNNMIYHNSFIDNRYPPMSYNSRNTWDAGFPCGGNYWSDYNGSDIYSGFYQNLTGSDGIGDLSHSIDVDNQDSYPLMGRYADFDVISEYTVQTICNSSISDFQFNGTAIRFNVTGEDFTPGFCRTCIPTALISETYKVYVNGTEVKCNLLRCSNTTYSYIYFSYHHSTQEVIITPEFPTWILTLLMLIVPTVAILLGKRRQLKEKLVN